jgi:hypothetical protein
MNFAELLILLMPGFLGLWTFKRIVQENIDKRGESTQLALALMLGLSSLFSLFLLDVAFSAIGLPVLPIKALLLPATGKEQADVFFISPQFWVVYGWLCFLAVYNGYWWALLRERWKLALPMLLGRWTAEYLKRPPKEDCESSLRAIVNNLDMERNGAALVRVYTLGENQSNPIIGFWGGYSETEREIELTLLELCGSAPDLNSIIEKQLRRCWINHESGVVIEFVESGKEFNEEIKEYLRSKYRRWKTGIVRLC